MNVFSPYGSGALVADRIGRLRGEAERARAVRPARRARKGGTWRHRTALFGLLHR